MTEILLGTKKIKIPAPRLGPVTIQFVSKCDKVTVVIENIYIERVFSFEL